MVKGLGFRTRPEFQSELLDLLAKDLDQFYKLSVPLFLIGKIPIEDYIEVIRIKGLLA